MANNELQITTYPTRISSPADGLTVERLRTIIQDSHINFLFGAGTSAPYFELLGDIELALTQLTQSDAAQPETNLARASLQAYFFEKVLLPNIPLLERKLEAKNIIKSYARLGSTLNRLLLKRRSTLLGKQVNIFTTNVDLALEVSLELLEIDVNDGFTGKLHPRLELGEFGTLRIRQGTRYEYRSEIPVMNLLKIHGSVSWRQEGDEIYFDHQIMQLVDLKNIHETAKPYLIPIAGQNEVNAEQLLVKAGGKGLHNSVATFVTAYNSLSLVNPEKTKFATTVLNKTYYELIRRLANELEKENCALFVHGFSFRDEHLRDIILRAARTNPTLQVIVFCYSRGGRNAVKTLVADEQIKNGNMLFVAPNEPEEGELERYITLDVLVEDYFSAALTESAVKADHIIELKLGSITEGDSDAG